MKILGQKFISSWAKGRLRLNIKKNLEKFYDHMAPQIVPHVYLFVVARHILKRGFVDNPNAVEI